MKPTVLSSVVDHDLCIGCGVCAAMCPDNVLEMQFNRFGEYNPFSIGECTKECGICLKVCPFVGGNPDEDAIGQQLFGDVSGIQHRHETGYFLNSYVGYSNVDGHREYGSSGGIATWLLEALLTEGVVDHVICVVPTCDTEGLFAFRVFDTPEDVRTGAGSVYYPVEISAVIRQVLETPGRYAITGLPCFIKAVRLAQNRNKKLRDRVVVTVGLTCGQLKSRHFTDYIAALAGVRGKVMRVHYRGKSPDRPASNYHYTFTTADGEERRIFWNEGIAEAWTNRWFTPHACNYCDDIFAECADVTCMDAWLPEYSKDSRGTSLVLVRSPLVQKVITGGQGGYLDPIPIERVLQSQAGVVEVKRQHMMYRIYLDQEKGSKVPEKRVTPKKPDNHFLRQEVFLKDQMQVASKDLWNSEEPDMQHFREGMRPYLEQVRRSEWISRVIMFPLRMVRQMMRGYRHG
jgi:coenzyme F420-reducing hydrogenase beta subunit